MQQSGLRFRLIFALGWQCPGAQASDQPTCVAWQDVLSGVLQGGVGSLLEPQQHKDCETCETFMPYPHGYPGPRGETVAHCHVCSDALLEGGDGQLIAWAERARHACEAHNTFIFQNKTILVALAGRLYRDDGAAVFGASNVRDAVITPLLESNAHVEVVLHTYIEEYGAAVADWEGAWEAVMDLYKPVAWSATGFRFANTLASRLYSMSHAVDHALHRVRDGSPVDYIIITRFDLWLKWPVTLFPSIDPKAINIPFEDIPMTATNWGDLMKDPFMAPRPRSLKRFFSDLLFLFPARYLEMFAMLLEPGLNDTNDCLTCPCGHTILSDSAVKIHRMIPWGYYTSNSDWGPNPFSILPRTVERRPNKCWSPHDLRYCR
eukprot:gnl/TRDRNA2_/TRDRNA2_126608_c0_seq2.p1 gnl/TRDRNA2_/TRDRNA2_126608_c0~~gnl/TRDRNA2_/TRDRNA2_126608_c0_seq2.p1  ORF type:complete len:377 (-),score=31.72 gnl/TRDRNA2_/TRDRNA2_126608_c0_seq2:5-1135(-)